MRPDIWKALLATSLLGACTSHITVLPTLALNRTDCASEFITAHATTLKFDSEVEEKSDARLGHDSPCVSTDDGKNDVYLVFALPQTQTPYTLSVRAIPEDSSLLAPRLILLDKDGVAVRVIDSDKFLIRGGGLTGLLQPRQAETFLVVESNHSLVGSRTSRLVETVSVTPIVAGPVVFSHYTGSENLVETVFSYLGPIAFLTVPTHRAS